MTASGTISNDDIRYDIVSDHKHESIEDVPLPTYIKTKILTLQGKKIVFMSFERGYLMKKTFARIMEITDNPYYSSDDTFSEQELAELYDKNEEDEGWNDYEKTVMGFNLPGSNMINFYNIFNSTEEASERINKEEKYFFDWLAKNGFIKYKGKEKLKCEIGNMGQFFVMTVNHEACKDDDDKIDDKQIKSTIQHEMSHALYHFDKKYRKKCVKAWMSMTDFQRAEVVAFLNDMMYSPEVYIDEFAAFTVPKKGNNTKHYRRWDKISNKAVEAMIKHFYKNTMNEIFYI